MKTLESLFGPNHKDHKCVLSADEIVSASKVFLHSNACEGLRFYSDMPVMAGANDPRIPEMVVQWTVTPFDPKQTPPLGSVPKILIDYTIQTPEMLLALLNRNFGAPRMRYNSLPGTKVVFDACGGGPYDRKVALDILELGKEYEVIDSTVGSSRSTIMLKGINGHCFNSCLFTKPSEEPEVKIGYLDLGPEL